MAMNSWLFISCRSRTSSAATKRRQLLLIHQAFSVAVVDLVEMDAEEEDAMLEAIQIDEYESNVEIATSE